MDDVKASERFDLLAESFATLDWSDEKKGESLECIFNHVSRHATSVISWYLISKKSKKQCAQILRLGTIIFTTAAALIPVLSVEIEEIHAVWATLILGLAAMCVGLDRYFGCSNAWMRYIVTEHKVRQLLHTFQIEREELRVDWENGKPDKEQVCLGLKKAKEFFIRVDETVRSETEQWRAEFQQVIKDINAIAKDNK